MFKDKMVDEISDDLEKRFKAQPDSRCASEDEVRIAYLLCKIKEVTEKLIKAKNKITSLKGKDCINKLFVWHDGSWIEASEYEDVVEAWRGDDFYTLDVPGSVLYEDMDAYIAEYGQG